jgi:hypothetical protein
MLHVGSVGQPELKRDRDINEELLSKTVEKQLPNRTVLYKDTGSRDDFILRELWHTFRANGM